METCQPAHDEFQRGYNWPPWLPFTIYSTHDFIANTVSKGHTTYLIYSLSSKFYIYKLTAYVNILL